MTPSRGVYFLANNKVYDSVVAFLNSFRFHNKDIPLCLVPFNSDFDQIAALQEKYHFSIFDDQDILDRCDEMSKQFHGNVCGAYRKLAIWEGEFEEFAYIDCDTVVLDNIDFAFDHLSHTPVFTSHSHIDGLDKWVWTEGIEDTGILNEDQIEYSANTGFIVSSKSYLSVSEVEQRLPDALKLKDYMFLDCMEQPLLNYLFITSGKPYSSLLWFFLTGVSQDIKVESWAGTPGGVIENGKLTLKHSLPIFLLHWAGGWLSDPSKVEGIPYAELWKHYRYMDL